MQIPTAGLAESALRPIVLAAIVAGQFQDRTASIAIIRIRVIGAVTPLTFHGIDQDPITFRIAQRSSGRRWIYIIKSTNRAAVTNRPVG